MRLKLAFVIIFAIIVLSPLFGLLTGIGVMSDHEMNRLEGRNREKLSREANFTRFVEDNLGLRMSYLNLYADITYGIFGQSMNENRVVPGRKGFFFLGSGFEDTFNRHSGLTGAFTPEQYSEMRARYQTLFDKIKSKGIPVVFAIAPDKATIYGEYYPAWVKRVKPSVHFDQIQNFSGQITIADILGNIRDRKSKFHDNLYFKTDTHWTPLGAWAGYETIMEAASTALGKPLESVKLENFEVSEMPESDHDLGRFMNRYLPDIKVTLDTVPKEQNNFLTAEIGCHNGMARLTINDQALNPQTVLFIQDSFFDYLRWPYLESFQTSIQVHRDILHTDVLKNILNSTVKIDLLVVLLVEREVNRASFTFAYAAEKL